MAKTTRQERDRRRERAVQLLADGLGPVDTASRLTAEWGCSRRTALRDTNLAQERLVQTIDQQSMEQLVAWCCNSYARLMNKAEAAQQFGAAVGALNGLCSLLVKPQIEARLKDPRTGSGRFHPHLRR